MRSRAFRLPAMRELGVIAPSSIAEACVVRDGADVEIEAVRENLRRDRTREAVPCGHLELADGGVEGVQCSPEFLGVDVLARTTAREKPLRLRAVDVLQMHGRDARDWRREGQLMFAYCEMSTSGRRG